MAAASCARLVRPSRTGRRRPIARARPAGVVSAPRAPHACVMIQIKAAAPPPD
jgi:hypothetical protein